ncbi:hypothetical protein ScPMuIL_018285 [Solemya velum]
MVEKERFLVVISVLEGRRFPKRSKHKLIAEARFDGELLASDPVDHVESPDFTQELAWELDKKGLQQHRLQRTSIKIQCYAYDTNSTMKETIGYIILDLRSAQKKQTPKWYPLLHSKYSKNKPELRLSLYLDEDKSGERPFHAKGAPPREIEPLSASETDAQRLRPVLNETEGFYQIGPEDTCTEQFVFSVTIAQAANLTQLIPSTQPLPPSASGYFFYYSLFGNDVTNEVFHDLISPGFPAERASVRIRSNIDTLRKFLASQPGVQVHLCCGDQSLGSCEVPLSNLLKKNSTEIYMKPVTMDGTFQMFPPNQVKKQMTVPQDTFPAVVVSIALKKEDMALRTPVKEPAAGQRQAEFASPTFPKSPGHQTSPMMDFQAKTRPKKVEMTDNIERVEYTDSFEDSTQENLSSLEEDKRKKGNKIVAQTSSKPVAPKPSVVLPDGLQSEIPNRGLPDSDSTTQHHISIPAQSHHFTLSIDLRSIKNVNSPTMLNVFLRYSYPFFGSAAPILTHPTVEVRKGMEVLLPQSFCAFDFACTVQQLQDTFLRIPLLVEVWHKDKQLSKDVLLGSGHLPLGQIVTAEKNRVVNSSGTYGWRQDYQDGVNVVPPDGKLHKVGEIAVVLSLEDWGSISTQVLAGQESSNTQSIAESLPQVQPRAEARETDEYKAAIELEMWKEQQEEMFENQLKQKEMVYMRTMAEEWKKRDRDRELLMKKKLAEYTQLEEHLRKTLIELEKREKQLAANEQEVMRLRTDLQREHDRKLQEMKEASRRMKEDCDHLVDLEKIKVRELEELITRYKQELSEAEKKYHSGEKDFQIYKEQQNTKPEVRLQSEINLLTLEKVELERKLDAVTKSKVHYKQQWGRALKELARLKQKEQTVAKAQLKRQQQELEHMRLRYLAAEEKEVVKSEKKELEDIKNELNRLRQLEENRSKPDEANRVEFEGMKPLEPDLDSSMDEHITRLIEERDTLLRTGVYSTHDKIIAELDRQIKESIAQKKMGV